MAVGCGAKCAKFLLIVFNFIFWLSGAAILGIGIWLRVDKGILRYMEVVKIDESDAWLNYVAYVLIGVGTFIFLVGFFGCCGAIRESRCLLGLYIFCLVLVMAGELAAGILAVIYQQNVKSKLKGFMLKRVQNEYKNDTLGVKTGSGTFETALDYVQMELKCCGVMGPGDYRNSTYNRIHTSREVPKSCCTNPAQPTCANIADSSTIKQGCYGAVEKWVNDHSKILIGVGIGIACLEIFGMVFAICLCRNIGEEE